MPSTGEMAASCGSDCAVSPVPPITFQQETSMAIDISKYNDTFKAFVDFASAAECPWGVPDPMDTAADLNIVL